MGEIGRCLISAARFVQSERTGTMPRKETTAVRTIASLERLRLSANGNPRFEVTFTDGSRAKTAVDASVAYGIENPEYRLVPLNVRFDGRGNIIGLGPVFPDVKVIYSVVRENETGHASRVRVKFADGTVARAVGTVADAFEAPEFQDVPLRVSIDHNGVYAFEKYVPDAS